MTEFGKKLSTTATRRSDLWLPPGEIVSALARQGDPIPTGWPPLDRRLRRGGIPPGRVVTIGGPPFTGKTTILADIALHMAQHARVFALFADEGRAQAAVRMGVMLGVPIDEIEEHPDRAGPLITERMGERTLELLKPETEFTTAEYVFDYAREKCGGKTGVVMLDSVQTIPAFETEPENERMGIKALMKLSRRAADEYNLIVICSSMSPRSFYRSKSAEERSVALASFLGDSSVEYLSDAVVVLSLPNPETEIVPVEIPKSRLKPFVRKGGAKIPSTFSVRYDYDAGRMLEVDDEEIKSHDKRATNVRLAPLRDRILATLKKRRKGVSRAKLQELLNCRKADLLAALSELVDAKKVYPDDEAGSTLLYVFDFSQED